MRPPDKHTSHEARPSLKVEGVECRKWQNEKDCVPSALRVRKTPRLAPITRLNGASFSSPPSTIHTLDAISIRPKRDLAVGQKKSRVRGMVALMEEGSPIQFGQMDTTYLVRVYNAIPYNAVAALFLELPYVVSAELGFNPVCCRMYCRTDKGMERTGMTAFPKSSSTNVPCGAGKTLQVKQYGHTFLIDDGTSTVGAQTAEENEEHLKRNRNTLFVVAGAGLVLQRTVDYVTKRIIKTDIVAMVTKRKSTCTIV
ncbi:hypothetical protein OUZ56_004250 [Daphnia magna]|uniref:Uncharacterized protein n=1 Tax=Daphnia magna TaxID=35525 RepID=A0ABQ9YP70_9CRUS|nr:hypothetical protein OUZ56_004250 [Daphnia magna]